MAWRCGASRAAGPVHKHCAARKPPSTRLGEAAVPVAWANRQWAPLRRRKALPMSHIACGSPPARRIARAISMGHFYGSLVLGRTPASTAYTCPTIIRQPHDRDQIRGLRFFCNLGNSGVQWGTKSPSSRQPAMDIEVLDVVNRRLADLAGWLRQRWVPSERIGVRRRVRAARNPAKREAAWANSVSAPMTAAVPASS